MVDEIRLSNSLKKIPIWLMIGAFFVLIYLGPLLGIYPAWHRVERIAHHGRTTIGTVVQKEPYNHQSVDFEYSVDGIKYFGNAAAGMGGLPLYESINIGDNISVTYWPKRPGESVGGDPVDAYRTMSFLLFVLVPCVSLFLAIIAAIGVRRGRTFMWPDVIDWLVRRKTASH